jgi:hypothetical protein
MHLLFEYVPWCILNIRKEKLIRGANLEDITVTAVTESSNSVQICFTDDDDRKEFYAQKNVITDQLVMISLFERMYPLQNMKTHHFDIPYFGDNNNKTSSLKLNWRQILSHSSRTLLGNHWTNAELFHLLSRQNYRCFITGIPFCFCRKSSCPFRTSLILLNPEDPEPNKKENVRYVCMFLSFMKGNLSLNTFLDFLTLRMTSYHQKTPIEKQDLQFHLLNPKHCDKNEENGNNYDNIQCNECFNIDDVHTKKLDAFRKRGRKECFPTRIYLTYFNDLIIPSFFSALSDSFLLSLFSKND